MATQAGAICTKSKQKLKAQQRVDSILAMFWSYNLVLGLKARHVNSSMGAIHKHAGFLAILYLRLE